MSTCPRCSAPLEGLGRYCHACRAYVADMQDAPDRPSPSQAILDGRTEAEIRLAVRAALELHGFVVVDLEQGYRRDGSTRVRRGLPDLAIMAPGGVFAWRELKSAKGRLTEEQRAFGDDCRRLGIDWAVWRHEGEAMAWAEAVRRSVA